MARFPITLDSDSTEVRDALEIARTQYVRGDLQDAMRWLRRAADIAFERGADERGVALSKAAVELGPPRPPGARPAPAQEPPGSSSVVPQPSPQPLPSAAPSQPRGVAPSPARSETGAARSAHARPPRPQPAPSRVPVASHSPSRTPASSHPPVSSQRAVLPRAPASGPSGPREQPVPRRPASGPPSGREGQPPPDAAPIPLTARKVEVPAEDDSSTDEITAITAMSVDVAAALAFDRPERALPAGALPAPGPARGSPSSRAPAPAVGGGTEPVTTRPSSPVARTASRQGPLPALSAHAPGDETTPSLNLTEAWAERAAPRPHQALRVALVRSGTGQVVVRALGSEGTQEGEVEALVVGVAPSTDLASLFVTSTE